MRVLDIPPGLGSPTPCCWRLRTQMRRCGTRTHCQHSCLLESEPFPRKDLLSVNAQAFLCLAETFSRGDNLALSFHKYKPKHTSAFEMLGPQVLWLPCLVTLFILILGPFSCVCRNKLVPACVQRQNRFVRNVHGIHGAHLGAAGLT